MSLKDILFNIVDKPSLAVFRRAKYYRELGWQYIDHIEKKMPEVLGAVGKENAEFLEEHMKDYRNMAYITVQGQTLLIDMDICGMDVDECQPAANQAALATGLLWYAIKLMDNYIEKKSMDPQMLDDFLQNIQQIWRKGKQIESTDNEYNALINSTSALLTSGYAGDPKGYQEQLANLADAEVKYIFSTPDKRIARAKEVGATSAELTTALVRQYFSDYARGYENFLIEQGIAGKLFDDLKDRKIDRELGRGYKSRQVPKLFGAFMKHYLKQYTALPTHRARWRNLNFTVLASLFHVQEILGKKGKS